MNWQRIGPYILDAGNGYRISKSMVGAEARYRASHQGSFIGAPVATLDEAKAQAKQHQEQK